jgi:hypothetical protein
VFASQKDRDRELNDGQRGLFAKYVCADNLCVAGALLKEVRGPHGLPPRLMQPTGGDVVRDLIGMGVLSPFLRCLEDEHTAVREELEELTRVNDAGRLATAEQVCYALLPFKLALEVLEELGHGGAGQGRGPEADDGGDGLAGESAQLHGEGGGGAQLRE